MPQMINWVAENDKWTYIKVELVKRTHIPIFSDCSFGISRRPHIDSYSCKLRNEVQLELTWAQGVRSQINRSQKRMQQSGKANCLLASRLN